MGEGKTTLGRGELYEPTMIRALSHFQQQRLESSEGVNHVKM